MIGPILSLIQGKQLPEAPHALDPAYGTAR
jgi:hypothetical protein